MMNCETTPADSMVVLIDMQERLVKAMNAAEAVTARQELLLEGAKLLQVPVVVTEQYPDGLGGTIRSLACRLEQGVPVLEKTAFSCFGAAGFRETLEARGVRTLILAGCEAHVCVLQTVLEALRLGYQVILCYDAVTSRRPDDVRMALKTARAAGALTVGVEAALFMLLRDAAHPAFKAVSRLVR